MALVALLFSYAIEALQYFKIVEIVGLEKSKFARVIIGTSFSWVDILAYTLGIVFVLLIEFIAAKIPSFAHVGVPLLILNTTSNLVSRRLVSDQRHKLRDVFLFSAK